MKPREGRESTGTKITRRLSKKLKKFFWVNNLIGETMGIEECMGGKEMKTVNMVNLFKEFGCERVDGEI